MLIAIYAIGLIAVTLLGANLPRLFKLDHTRTQLIMSFVSGIMLGVAVFHLLPHAIYSSAASVDFIALWLMAGLLGMFFLQRLFHFHHHEFEEPHGDGCAHSHEADSDAGISQAGAGVFLGLLIHSVIDGVVLGSAIQADVLHVANASSGVQAGLVIAGLGVFIAIVLHKPLDALTLSIFLKRGQLGGFTRVATLVGYALVCPLTAAFLLSGGFSPFEWLGGRAVSAALAFSTGIFLCIALSDLLPEIHFHNHDRFKMTLVLLLGVAAAYAIRSVETESRHQYVDDSSYVDQGSYIDKNNNVDQNSEEVIDD